METTSPQRSERPSPRTALNALVEGNVRFSEGRSERPHQSDEHRRALVGGQAPFAVVLACSDSRVTVEFLLDQGFGDLFVVRNAGHVLSRSVLASVEFAVTQLDVSAALVLGHESCGAVAAARQFMADGRDLPGAMPALVEGVQDHLDPADPGRESVDRHVLGTVQDLLASSALLREALEGGRLAVAGAVYGLADGRIRVLTEQGALE